MSVEPHFSMKPPTSLGARACHSRHSQVVMASDTARAVNFMQPLDSAAHRNGLAGAAQRPAAPAEAAERRRDVGRSTIEAAVHRWHVGSIARHVYA